LECFVQFSLECLLGFAEKTLHFKAPIRGRCEEGLAGSGPSGGGAQTQSARAQWLASLRRFGGKTERGCILSFGSRAELWAHPPSKLPKIRAETASLNAREGCWAETGERSKHSSILKPDSRPEDFFVAGVRGNFVDVP
jgi:hypothetical protein